MSPLPAAPELPALRADAIALARLVEVCRPDWDGVAFDGAIERARGAKWSFDHLFGETTRLMRQAGSSVGDLLEAMADPLAAKNPRAGDQEAGVSRARELLTSRLAEIAPAAGPPSQDGSDAADSAA